MPINGQVHLSRRLDPAAICRDLLRYLRLRAAYRDIPRHFAKLLTYRGLLKKHILYLLIGLIASLGSLALWSFQTLEESTQEILRERLIFAQMLAGHIDEHLQETIARLQGVAALSQTVDDTSLPLPRELLTQTIASSPDPLQALMILDSSGTIILTEPEGFATIGTSLANYTFVNNAIVKGQADVSGILRFENNPRPSIAIAVPIKRNDNVIGSLLAALDPAHPSTAGLVPLTTLGTTGYAQVVDDNGFLIGTTRPDIGSDEIDHGARFIRLIKSKQSIVSTCHRCHETNEGLQRSSRDVIAFAPLSVAPWGVAIRQSEDEAFALVRSLGQKMILVTLVSVVVLAYLAFTITRSIIVPIRTLTTAAQRIARGDFRGIIPTVGSDEIKILAQSLEAMRHGLNAAREEVERRNQELQARTEEVQRKERQRRQLLNKVIQAQEEERKRIARELHDEIGQSLTALIIALGSAEEEIPAELSNLRQRLNAISDLTATTLAEIRRLMLDLRPTLLDDLGLLPAISWYAEKQLGRAGVQFQLETDGLQQRLPSTVETALFRVIQEAITNITKHAAATHAKIKLALHNSTISAVIEDNGRGFDPHHHVHPSAAGLGLLGMEERVILLGGSFQIESCPGHGTRLTCTIPITERRQRHAKDSGAHS